MSWLTKWFRGKTQVRSKPVRRPRTVRLSLEALEDRQLMATNLTATLTGGLLRVEATAGADTVHVRQSDNQISVDGIAIQTGTSSQASVAVSLVNQVEIRSLAGNDQIWLGDVGKALAVPVRLLDGLAGDTLFIPTIPGSLTLGSDEQSLATCTDTSNGSTYVIELLSSGALRTSNGSGVPTANQIAEFIWQSTPDQRLAAFNSMTAGRAGEVLWTYDWSRFVSAFNTFSAPRAGEILWTYDWSRFVQSFSQFSAARAGEILWTYDWSRFVQSFNQFSAARAGEILWTYDWSRFVQSFNQFSATRAADIVWTYDPDVIKARLDQAQTVTSPWIEQNLKDSCLRLLSEIFTSDEVLSRSEMLAIFREVEQDGTVSAAEFSDLKTVVPSRWINSSLTANGATVSVSEPVRVLANYVINGNAANAQYQSGALGNLAAGSTSTQLQQLVNKWFLGLDHPNTSSGYFSVSGTLFQNGIRYTDIDQNALGDCYFMSALSQTALRSQSTIQDKFTDNLDGTYTVRFWHIHADLESLPVGDLPSLEIDLGYGEWEYVTVDNQLPTSTTGRAVFAGWGGWCGHQRNKRALGCFGGEGLRSD